jgi:NAD(P)-dependent dehydrogenase (short-subunit alcohol dehydrogenase family)
MGAEALTAAGARVIVTSRMAAEADLPRGCEGFAGDVATEEGITAIGAEVRSRTNRLDILFNNAGAVWGDQLGRFPYRAWADILAVNLAGPFGLTQELLPELEQAATDEHPSRVVNTGSVMGEIPMGDGAYSYAASKSGVHHVTRILAKELAPRRITVNALAPGPFVSKMTAFATEDEATRKKVGAQVPLGRVGRPQDIAAALLYLCGAGGSYVTGAILPVSGGINVQTGPAIFREALS